GNVWEIEFGATAPGDGGAGLRRVDHVAQTMNYEDMLSWVLFYTAIFDTTKSPMIDVLDPSGLVRSQVVESPGGRLRLTLNGADNSRTIAGHFISETFGSSTQHLAFACDDIFATAAAMAARGFRRLQIQPNYYEDLAARFGIAPDLLARLRDHDILYDRDADGEFFQFYSGLLGEGFFFEIVERRGDYRGYGGPNAPFRIAAQRRAMRPENIPAR